MPKFRKRSEYPKKETATPGPEEQPIVAGGRETTVNVPRETPVTIPDEICGINGCSTCYDDPVVMARHRLRVHGVVANLNQPDLTRDSRSMAEIQDEMIQKAVERCR